MASQFIAVDAQNSLLGGAIRDLSLTVRWTGAVGSFFFTLNRHALRPNFKVFHASTAGSRHLAYLGTEKELEA